MEDEKPENLVWVWSDKAPALMEAEEGDDLSAQFFEIARASGACPTVTGHNKIRVHNFRLTQHPSPMHALIVISFSNRHSARSYSKYNHKMAVINSIR